MNTAKSFLCVGGPMNGQTVAMHPRATRLEVAVPRPVAWHDRVEPLPSEIKPLLGEYRITQIIAHPLTLEVLAYYGGEIE